MIMSKGCIPIQLSRGLYLDPKLARAYGEDLSSVYSYAEPYPFIVLDEFLPEALANEILNNFPIDNLAEDKYYESGYSGLHKRQIMPINCNETVRNFFSFFNSAPILQFLEGLTSINGLIPDPYFNGGGFHEIKSGGKLGVHADFRINEQLHLSRRLNMLIYLNKDWEECYGGSLEIWDREGLKCVESIRPIFNRCVIFNTDATSYHGHPDPLNTPMGITRKSIALYYYTASKEIYNEMPSFTTMYKARYNDSMAVKKEVAVSRLYNYLKDYLPPVLYRYLSKIKR